MKQPCKHSLSPKPSHIHINTYALWWRRGFSLTPGSTAALIPAKREENIVETGSAQLHLCVSVLFVSVCLSVMWESLGVCLQIQMTQIKISLHFLDGVTVLFQPHVLLCLGISQYLLTNCTELVTHRTLFSMCVSDTCFGNVAIRLSSFRQATCRRIAALHEHVFWVSFSL